MCQVKQYLSILLGTFIIALCFNLLQSPNQIASGGLTGASLVLGFLFNITSSMVLWVMTLILLVIGCGVLGVQTILKSAFGSLLIPILVYLTKGLPPLTHDALLASILSGLGIGIGLAVVFRAGGNMGGFTLIAQILNKKRAIKHSTSIMIMDVTVLIAGGIVFSAEKALYALVGSFVTRMTMEFIQVKNKDSKVAYIISSIEYENKISTSILYQLDRGLTKIAGSGGYTNNERIIMMTVLNPLKVNKLKSIIQEIDPHSFIIVCDATEVFGEGFFDSVTSQNPKLITSKAV